MNPKGILEADMQLLFTHIHYEINDGDATAQLSFPDLGDLNNEVKGVTATDNALDIVFDLNGFDMLIHIKKRTAHGLEPQTSPPSASTTNTHPNISLSSRTSSSTISAFPLRI